ncbi:unnamed protein product [Paramecium primaurelia]|uniref:Uncharacterized protein n=1 Tax=Paramecium primaurelia TaxID=5886 RepID=A0A8S1PIV7_PARPR|nr:unnamed protein product [Paramecium primaurelia]
MELLQIQAYFQLSIEQVKLSSSFQKPKNMRSNVIKNIQPQNSYDLQYQTYDEQLLSVMQLPYSIQFIKFAVVQLDSFISIKPSEYQQQSLVLEKV